MKKMIFQNFDKIIKGGGILFIGMSVVNVGNYLFNLLVGRSLGPIDYGIFTSLTSILAITGVIGGTLTTTATKFSSIYNANSEYGKINYLIGYLNKKGLLIGLAISLIVILLAKFIARFLNIGELVPIILLSLVYLLVFPLSVNRGILQGMQNFIQLSINSVLEPFAKIILSVIFIWLGWKINGVILAIVFSIIIVYSFSFYPLKKILKNHPKIIEKNNLWNYSITTLVALVFSSTLIFSDIILVKHYFDPHEAGLYSAVSTIAKIILYGSTPIVTVMFPMIANLQAKEKKHYYLLIQTFLLVILLTSLVLGFFVLFPEFSIRILFGNQYLQVAKYLGGLSFAFFLFSLCNVFINYFLSIRKNQFVWIMLLAATLQISLISIYHENLYQIINSLIITYGSLLFSLTAMYLISKKEQITYAISNNSRS